MEISWLVEGKVLRLAMNGNLTEKQLTSVDDQMIKFLKAGSALMVHIVLDGERLTGLPTINDLSRMRALAHPRAGWVVTTGLARKPTFKTAFMLLAQILQFRHAEADHLQNALSFLESVDPELPESYTGIEVART
jgi:hypothetical protein